METQVIFIIVMVFIISILTMLANKMRIAYPVLLVVAGLFISFLPMIPRISIDPGLIFYIFLPPLLFQSAVALPLKDVLRWKRVILSFAFLVVLLTAAGVGLLTSWMIPGMTFALGMVLGGIVSSTDAVSATTIMHQVKVPSRVSTILEGESMLNDASSLITFSFALIAVQTGQFVWHQVILSFCWMVAGGAIIGILVGAAFVYMHKLLPMDSNVTIVFTMIAPYLMYIMAEAAGASGVLGVVCGGFYMSQHLDALDSSSHLLGSSVWDNTVFILNGFAFLMIGLDLPEIVSGIEADGISVIRATFYGLAITALIMALRMLNAYLAIPISRFRREKMHLEEKHLIVDSPTSFVIGWCGMRGVLSLAAALSIPLLTPSGEAFPQRSMILYCSFIVILATLLIQGLTLPLLLKHIHFPKYHDHINESEARDIILRGLAECSLEYIKKNPQVIENDDVMKYIMKHFQSLLEREKAQSLLYGASTTYHHILEKQRSYLYSLNKKHPSIDEELIRHYIRRIDLEDERLKSERRN